MTDANQLPQKFGCHSFYGVGFDLNGVDFNVFFVDPIWQLIQIR
jgi:hypothetical protein